MKYAITVSVSAYARSTSLRTQICDKEKIIEKLYGTRFMMLLVDNDITATCLAIASECGCIRGISIGRFLDIPRLGRQELAHIFVDRIGEEPQWFLLVIL